VRIHAHDEDELQSLLLYLTRTPDTVVTALSDLELEVSFLGSLNDHAQRTLLRKRLSDWRPERHVPACEQFNEAMVSRVERVAPDLVILAAHWSEPGDRFTSAEMRAAPGVSVFRTGLENTMRRIVSARTRVCVVLDVPELDYRMPQALLTARQRGLDTEFLRITRTELEQRYGSTVADIRAVADSFDQAVVDPKERLCPGERCDIGNATEVYYMDKNHLTIAGARVVTPTIEGCFVGLAGSETAQPPQDAR